MKNLAFENTMCDPIHEENNWMFIASNGDTVLIGIVFICWISKQNVLKTKKTIKRHYPIKI